MNPYATRWAVILTLSLVTLAPAADGGTFVAGEWRADTPFPEFMPLWREGWNQFDERGDRVRHAYEGMPLGGYLHVFVQNTGDKVELNDVLLNGISLKQAIAPEGKGRGRYEKYASNLQFSNLSEEQVQTLLKLGDPVWWKIDPVEVEPGGMATAVVRLRRTPQVATIDVQVAGDHRTIPGKIDINSTANPQIVNLAFSPTMDEVCLYVTTTGHTQAPNAVLVDNKPASAARVPEPDLHVDPLPVVARLSEPVTEGSFHVFAVRWTDGAEAIAAVRVHRPDFIYGMWGGFLGEKGPLEEKGKRYLDDLYAHNINMIMSQYGGGVREYVRSPAGQALCNKLNIPIMDHNPRGFANQRYTFLHDEPDAKDVNMTAIKSIPRRLGAQGQWLVEMGREYRRSDPATLQLLNIDNTFKPEQWYMYGQLADVACADPYYQSQLRSVYRSDPGALSAYLKPTYVYAVGRVYQSACAPRPMHLILHTCRFDGPDYPFRPPTPEEKRVELYYSIAAGARGISFWWYTPSNRSHGIGSDAPALRRLFAEIGLVGAEFRSAAEVLNRACPAELPIQAPRSLWVRPLLSGTETIVLLVVNDEIASDRVGTVFRPVEGAKVDFTSPAWLKPRDVFEVTCEGMKDIKWQQRDKVLATDLGKVELTRFLVVTADEGLRSRLQQTFDAEFADRARQLLDKKAKLADQGE